MDHASLREALVQFLSPHPSRRATAEVVGLFHRIAATYLGKKAYSGSLDPAKFGLGIDDLALDCIAPLFARDSTGSFQELAAYFKDVDLAVASETDLMAHCRRLVFSRVNQELFARYGEIDPSLHKIIRNLKTAVHKSRTCRLDCRHDELCIQFREAGEEEQNRPVIPPEFFEAYLAKVLARSRNLQEILEEAAACLADQELYRPSYPLTGFALLVRSGFARGADPPPGQDDPAGHLTEDELLRFIDDAVREIKAHQKQQYVGKGKLPAELYEKYFAIIREILAGDYLGDNGDDLSYYDRATSCLGPVSREEYGTKHRTYLEYLTRLTRGRFLVSVRREM